MFALNARHGPPRTVFLLGNGRSGTRFLCGLFRTNIKQCLAVHEPYLSAGRPAMFGAPIYYLSHGKRDQLRRVFAHKEKRIRSCRATWYVETNHAFLKSFADLAAEEFPDLKLVHVVRNPLKVCASQVNREEFNHRYHVPFRYYYVNGRRYYRWRLTGDEPIYQHFDAGRLSLFQTFFIQWIEIENRAQQFLDRYHKRDDCFLLHTPRDLNDRAKIEAMFDFLGMQKRREHVVLQGTRNFTPGRRHTINPVLVEQMRQVVDQLPHEHLSIFDRDPYRQFDWSSLLRKRLTMQPVVG